MMGLYRLALSALSAADPRAVLTSRSTTITDQQVFNVKIPFEGAPVSFTLRFRQRLMRLTYIGIDYESTVVWSMCMYIFDIGISCLREGIVLYFWVLRHRLSSICHV